MLEKQNIYTPHVITMYFYFYMSITPFESRCLFGVRRAKGRRYNNLASWKGVKSTVKQAYASRGESSHSSLCAMRRTVVNGSLLQCPLKSLTTIARDKMIVLSPASASRTFYALWVLATGEIAALSTRITSCSTDYSCAWRAIIPPI